MMRIGLFSDIHANLPALESFTKDSTNKGIDALYCLGDLIGYNIWPNEIVDYIRSNAIGTIAGNHDYNISRLGKGNVFLSKGEMTNGAKSVNFTNELLTDENRVFLKALPKHIKLYQENYTVLLVHGSPNANNEYMREDIDSEYLEDLFNQYEADIICCGHTHIPFHKTVEIEGETKHLINIGSVGKPKDKDVRGCYATLDLTEDIEDIKVVFNKFEYDVEKAAKAIEDCELPDAFAQNLRQGF